jgi:uncharacterized membrane protein
MMLDNPFLYLVAITLIPWIELRGAIPLGIAMGIDPFQVFLVCTLVNIAIIPPAFLFLDIFFPFFENIPLIKPLLMKTRKKSSKYVEKYGGYGLAIFVAIPLPGSGAYSGALAAKIFCVDRKIALCSITAGVVAAGLLVTLLSTGLFKLVL